MGDETLFGTDEPDATAAPEPERTRILTSQVAQIRGALDGLELATMHDRQRVIEEILGRRVTALRDLYADEVRVVLEGIHARKPKARTTSGSAWDDRDEDTWIDRL